MRQGLAAGTAVLALAASGWGCGYRVAGRGDLLPRNIHTIAIPAFANMTTRYKLSERLPVAIAREFVSRTRYKVVQEPNQADAILQGAITGYNSNPTIFDPATGRASAVQLNVLLDVTLRERATGTVLYSQTRMEFRERYEISVDQRAYFEESDTALDRLSRDVAQTLVSAVLEKF
jgi:hypothetical protein